MLESWWQDHQQYCFVARQPHRSFQTMGQNLPCSANALAKCHKIWRRTYNSSQKRVLDMSIYISGRSTNHNSLGKHTVSTQTVLFSTNDPGEPNRTIPPSVGLLIRLFLIFVLAQATEMPSAQWLKVSVPHGPMSLFCTVALEHFKPPSAMWRQDQERVSNERTYSTSCPDVAPPISMFAPPETGGAPERFPFILHSV